MPKKIDPAVKERCVRQVLEHLVLRRGWRVHGSMRGAGDSPSSGREHSRPPTGNGGSSGGPSVAVLAGRIVGEYVVNTARVPPLGTGDCASRRHRPERLSTAHREDSTQRPRPTHLKTGAGSDPAFPQVRAAFVGRADSVWFHDIVGACPGTWLTPLLEVAAMSKARLIITAVTIEKRPVAEVAATYGVSRSWLYELLARYRDEGEAALHTAVPAPAHLSGRDTSRDRPTGLAATQATHRERPRRRTRHSALAPDPPSRGGPSRTTIHRTLTRQGLSPRSRRSDRSPPTSASRQRCPTRPGSPTSPTTASPTRRPTRRRHRDRDLARRPLPLRPARLRPPRGSPTGS